jgi:hypothetical protein
MLMSMIPSSRSQEIIQSNQQSVKDLIAMINTEVDPTFVYDYHQTKFVPPPGKTLLIMGQTVERIEEYTKAFPNQKIPGGWASYWGVTEFKGIDKAHKFETGNTQDHQMLVKKFPNTIIQSALWMVGKWNITINTRNGIYDKVIKKFAKWAKKAKRPIYLRIGYEFDGPHNELEPKDYKSAYRHIVDLMREEGVKNVAYVWHSYASKPYKDYPISAWYPGDDYVDWVGVSVFFQPYYGTGLGPDGDAVLEFAKEHHKPVMIAESNPILGIEKDNNEIWNKWFANYFSFVYNKNIKAISFINEDWTTIKIPGIEEWKDSRMYNNTAVSRAWFEETNKDRYLKQSADLYDQLGYRK